MKYWMLVLVCTVSLFGSAEGAEMDCGYMMEQFALTRTPKRMADRISLEERDYTVLGIGEPNRKCAKSPGEKASTFCWKCKGRFWITEWVVLTFTKDEYKMSREKCPCSDDK
jgi:hypothetical protein